MKDLVITGELPEEPSNQVIALAKDLGYEGEVTLGALEDEVRMYQRRTAEACIELGKRLLLIKELAPRGQFEERAKLLGFSRTSAYRFMQTAKKFSNRPKLGQLAASNESACKFLELLILDEDDLTLLEEGGSPFGVALDEIECMSVSELKAAIRDRDKRLDDMTNSESKTVKVLKSDLEHKDSIIANLTVKKAYQFLPQTHHVREECLAYQAECELALNSIWAMFEDAEKENINEPEWRLRTEQIWITAHVVAARAADMLDKVRRSVYMPDDMPNSITIKHILTDDEATSWLLEYPMIERKHETAKATRVQTRIDSQPKGPGRPRK